MTDYIKNLIRRAFDWAYSDIAAKQKTTDTDQSLRIELLELRVKMLEPAAPVLKAHTNPDLPVYSGNIAP